MLLLLPPDHVAPLLDDHRDHEHELRPAVLDRLEEALGGGRGRELHFRVLGF